MKVISFLVASCLTILFVLMVLITVLFIKH